MRTSHLMIRKRILALKDKITDEEFFTSREYRSYLTDLTEAATKRYGRPIRVQVKADPEDDTIAFTDPTGVYINACNRITWSFPSRKLRSLSIEGLLAHENGHNLFTDTRIWNTHLMKMQHGTFYPKKPTGLTGLQKLYADEILEALKDENDPVPGMVVMNTIHTLSNILEDGYVDRRYSYEFPGTPARGIALNNVRYGETVPDITEMVNKKYYDHNIVMNLLIQYVRLGEVNNLSGYSGEFMDVLLRLLPVVDDCVYDDDPRARCSAANAILIELWPLMQRCFDALRDQYEQDKQKQQQGQQGSGSGFGTGGEAEAGDPAQGVQNALDEQLPQQASTYAGMASPVPSNGSFTPGDQSMKATLGQMAKVIAEESDRIAQHVTNGITSSGDGGLDRNEEYEGFGYDSAAEDIERVLETMAEHVVHEKVEQELSEELQREAQSISYGNAHRGIHITVNRMSFVSPELIESYNRVAPELLQLSKRLQRSVRSVLTDKRQGGKQTGLLVGKRLNQHAFHRTDGRIFLNSRLPTEPINLSVGLLVDESGSMSANDRITRARATSIVIQDFCESLGIPLLVMGHTADCSMVDLFSYCDFDSVDRMDRYRLMDMSARCCNRDGAALRFVADKLYRHESEVKLLIIICDGQPNDNGYSGTAAEADLRGIKLEYARKGVCIHAAAIGDDRENIERIYGSGFLDITDLNQLPIILTDLIKRNLPM